MSAYNATMGYNYHRKRSAIVRVISHMFWIKRTLVQLNLLLLFSFGEALEGEIIEMH